MFIWGSIMTLIPTTIAIRQRYIILPTNQVVKFAPTIMMQALNEFLDRYVESLSDNYSLIFKIETSQHWLGCFFWKKALVARFSVPFQLHDESNKYS